MIDALRRENILTETGLPDADYLMAGGKSSAAEVTLGVCPFLSQQGVVSEADYKRHAALQGQWMHHAQVGWRDPDLTVRNIAEISNRIEAAGGYVDRYGICLDWSMGYPPDEREGRARGTGLVLRTDEDFTLIANASNGAPHFGDFVIGMPAAVENTTAALRAGATSIGNLGQYFTFRLPDWDDDVMITSKTVEAISLCAAMPSEIIIHSNMDDGFAARFSDLACALGAVLLEKHIVEGLLGARIGHCYGHTFSNLASRQAFHLALNKITQTPGTMIYGNTTAFSENEAESYAALAAYLSADMAALHWAPSGHALTPIPITEARRIPTVDEIIDAHLFSHKLAERLEGTWDDGPPSHVSNLADKLVENSQLFFDNTMRGMTLLGYNTEDPFEMLLALRRIGAAKLERAFGPGKIDANSYYGRAPVVASSIVHEISEQAQRVVDDVSTDVRERLSQRLPRICLATTDVHEYGKRLVEQVLSKLGIDAIDGGISVDPDDLVQQAIEANADVIALSTYNGIAEGYIDRLVKEIAKSEQSFEVFVGGRLNSVPDGSNTGLPVDVEKVLAAKGVVVCGCVEDMLNKLSAIATEEL